MLTRGKLLRILDVPAIEAEIARAEARTSAEIRISLAPWFWGDVRRTAERAFQRLGMFATRERDAVLLFVVPARRSFAVIADTRVHARVGAGFWLTTGERLSAAFAAGRYTDGLREAVATIGERLAHDFPADAADNPDELSNRID